MKNQVEICPLRLAMDIIGGKWRLIKRGVPGITNVMLSQSLKHLEECRIPEKSGNA